MNSFTKRLIALAGATLLTIGAIPTASAVYREDVPFEGVPNWALMEITSMDRLGLIPEELAYSDMSDIITREEMCSIVVSAYEEVSGYEAPMPASDPFTDTQNEDVSKAYALGIVQGDGLGTFRPEGNLTRLEFFCFVSRFLTATGMYVDPSLYADLSRFKDTNLLPKWGVESAQVTVGLGIVEGSGTTLDPLRTATIAETLVLFYRARNVAVDSDPADAYTDLPAASKRNVLRMEQLGMVPATVKKRSLNTNLNRTELSQMVMAGYYLLTGLTAEDLGTPDAVFTDTTRVDALNAYALGLMNDRGDGIFDPGGAISRHEFYRTAAKLLEAVGYDSEIIRDLSVYTDYADVPSASSEGTQLMVALGIAKTSNKALEPKKFISGLDAILMLKDVVDFYADWSVDGKEPEPYLGQEVVKLAKKYEGYDYTYGGKKPSTGFDCSGYVYYIYKQFGYTLNPGARNQYSTIDRYIKKADLLPGDIIFFSKTSKASGIFHVGIYIGDGKVIHASSGSDEVKISKLSTDWYTKYYFGAKRAIG